MSELRAPVQGRLLTIVGTCEDVHGRIPAHTGILADERRNRDRYAKSRELGSDGTALQMVSGNGYGLHGSVELRSDLSADIMFSQVEA